MKTFKTLTSFFRFYYHSIKGSPKRYNIAMNSNEILVTLLTPVVMFIIVMILAFCSIVPIEILMLWIIFIPANLVFLTGTQNEGFRLRREEDERRREAERHEEARRRAERERAYQKIWEQYWNEELEKKRRQYYQQQQQRQQQQHYQQADTHYRNIANAKKLMGLPEDFTEKDVKKAYRRLAKIHHPDAGGLEANFIKLNRAYNYLMNNI